MTEESGDKTPHAALPEALWPILAAVVVVLTLTILRPPEIRVTPVWVMPTMEVLLLAALIASNPARLHRGSAVLRVVSICVVAVVVTDTLIATVRLVDVLIHGGQTTNSADALLAVGALVWVSNVVAFALLYWLLDSGGPAARMRQTSASLDLAFPQQLSPEVARPGWRPRFIDYLYVGLTSSLAFSPTDVMPLAPWAKVAMGAQSLISLAVVGLVIARAVNVFT